MNPSSFYRSKKNATGSLQECEGSASDAESDLETDTEFSLGSHSSPSSTSENESENCFEADGNEENVPDSEDDASIEAEEALSSDWNDITASVRSFPFTGNEQLLVSPLPSEDNGVISPIDIYKLFVTDEILQHIVEETNRYAEKC